jgi:hypothetical protein
MNNQQGDVMKRYPNFRANLVRYASTALTVSLLVTLRLDTPCTVPSGAAPSHELHEVGLGEP